MARVRTNIEIEDVYVQAIMDRYGVRTKIEAVELALRHLAGQPMTRDEALRMGSSRPPGVRLGNVSVRLWIRGGTAGARPTSQQTVCSSPTPTQRALCNPWCSRDDGARYYGIDCSRIALCCLIRFFLLACRPRWWSFVTTV